MFSPLFLFFSAFMALSALCTEDLFARTSGWDPKSNPYPAARRDDITFSYRSASANGNVTVADPYNYLEKSSDSSKEVQTFENQQANFFKTYTNQFKDLDAIRASIKDAGYYDELQFPQAFGSKDKHFDTFYHRELGSDNRIFYVATQADMDQAFKTKFNPLPGVKVFDDSVLQDGKSAYSQNLSPDGKTFFYRVRKKNSDDLSTIYLRNISSIFTNPQSVKDLPEIITGASDLTDGWTADSNGFFYLHNDATYDDGTDAILYHKLGTSVKEDIIVVKSENDPNQSKDFQLSNDKKFLIVYIFTSSEKARIYIASLDQPISSNMKWTSIVPEESLQLDYVTNLDNEFYFVARYDNESNQVIKYKVDLTKARQVGKLEELKDKATTEPTVIPEDKSTLIDRYTTFDTDKMFLCYTQDAKRNFYIYDLRTGKRIQHVLPDYEGSSSSITSLSTGTDIFLWSWTFNTPGQLYHIKWNPDQGSATGDLVYQARLKSIDSSKFNVELKYAVSKDSTKIPFHLFYKKGTVFDGTRPAIVNFMGAFSIIWLPSYKPIYMSWVNDYNAIFALAYPRGGGEVKGEEWHQAGAFGKEQNTIDDINAVIKYLIESKIAAKGKVILHEEISGATNSMIVANQAEEGIIGTVISHKGKYVYALYDLLRFNSNIDSQEYVTEYGDPQQDPKAFDWLRKLSPLHNVDKTKTYPAILLMPGTDDPITSWHSRKMIAELQYDLPNNPNPLFYNPPDPTLSDDENINQESAYAIAFASQVLDLQRNSD